eukprot:7331279-Prymnesium_polylepis.1
MTDIRSLKGATHTDIFVQSENAWTLLICDKICTKTGLGQAASPSPSTSSARVRLVVHEVRLPLAKPRRRHTARRQLAVEAGVKPLLPLPRVRGRAARQVGAARLAVGFAAPVDVA